MGGGAWSEDHYTSAKVHRAATKTPTFAYDADVKAGKASGTHKDMSPQGLKVRESRDSTEHPASLAIVIGEDVTGSQHTVPKQSHDNLPRLMGLLLRKGYVDHPQILVAAIGDVECDQSPLQVGQFESDNRIEEWLSKIHLEGDGGGQGQESYDLFFYFLARHTSIDCHEKRGKRGYCFMTCDERIRNVSRDAVKKVFGETIEADIPYAQIVKEAQEKYDIYAIVPRDTYGGQDGPSGSIVQHWKSVLGAQQVLFIEGTDDICEVIAGQIGILEGRADPDTVEQDLVDVGVDPSKARAVGTSLAVANQHRPKGTRVAIPGSGVGGGLAKF